MKMRIEKCLMCRFPKRWSLGLPGSPPTALHMAFLFFFCTTSPSQEILLINSVSYTVLRVCFPAPWGLVSLEWLLWASLPILRWHKMLTGLVKILNIKPKLLRKKLTASFPGLANSDFEGWAVAGGGEKEAGELGFRRPEHTGTSGSQSVVFCFSFKMDAIFREFSRSSTECHTSIQLLKEPLEIFLLLFWLYHLKGK